MTTVNFKKQPFNDDQSGQQISRQTDYWDLSDNQRLLVDSLSKIFNTEAEEFINIIGLFCKADFHLVRALECLGRVEKGKMINAVILLEYLLCSGDQALDIVNENDIE